MDEPKPKQHSIQFLQQMVDSGIADSAQDLINRYNYPYKIIDNSIVEVGESTGAWLAKFITIDEDMLTMKADVRKLAIIDDVVLISGDTGTGKEIIAHSLHGDKKMSEPFLALNCAAVPEHLIESELFGHVKGAFTGAERDNHGLMKSAKGGTLFLDEVGELPLPMQAKLLRAIQEREVRKVGSSKVETINCKIVCATHRDLEVMADKDEFRLDLYARLSTFEIDLTPLKLRTKDIIPILKSITGGQAFIDAMLAINKDFHMHPDFDIKLNVRSLQKHVKRFTVLGHLPKLT